MLKMRVGVCLLALAGLVLVAAVEVEEEENVLVVTGDNYEKILEENEFLLLEFYAPWCGHCKSLAPEYAKAATQLKEEGSTIRLGKVDATVETELAQNNAVRGYPTIKFFKNGKQSEFSGGRTANEIVNWLYKRTGPPAQLLQTVEEVKEFTEKDDVVVIGYVEDEKSQNAKAYISAADSQDSIFFGLVTSKEIAAAVQAKFDSIIVYKKFDEEQAVYNGAWNIEEIVTFILGEQLPLVTKFTDDTAPKIFGGKIKTHLLAFFAGDDKEIIKNLREVAGNFRGKVLFVHVDTEDDASDRVIEYFGIEDDSVPTCRLINLDEDMTKFVPKFSGVGANDIKDWVATYLEGDLKAHLNTEDIPEDWNSEPVKVLVGKNFDEVAMDKTKHVFIEFYAPWCGHCKQLAPIWEQLAEHFEEDKDVVIAKMDATKNEIESVSVQAFPTLKWITNETNEVLDYSGERTLDELIQYVEDMVAGKRPENKEEDEEDNDDDADNDDADSDDADSDDDDDNDNTGEYTGDNTGEYTGDDTGEYTGDDTGEYTGDDTGEYTGDDDNTDYYVDDNTGDDVDDNTGDDDDAGVPKDEL